MEPTNIAEILRNAPVGTLLYSPMVGYVNLVGVHDDVGKRDIIEVEPQFGHKPRMRFDKYGKYVPDGERMLFPSKFKKDWDGWQCALFQYGNFITRIGAESETLVISKDSTDMAYRANGSRTVISQTDYRWATDVEKIAFLCELGKNGLEWDEATLEIFAPLPETFFTEERYKEATDKIEDLLLENLKLNAVLLLAGLYNVKNITLHSEIYNRIDEAKTQSEVNAIVWEYHRKFCPEMVEKIDEVKNLQNQK